MLSEEGEKSAHSVARKPKDKKKKDKKDKDKKKKEKKHKSKRRQDIEDKEPTSAAKVTENQEGEEEVGHKRPRTKLRKVREVEDKNEDEPEMKR